MGQKVGLPHSTSQLMMKILFLAVGIMVKSRSGNESKISKGKKMCNANKSRSKGLDRSSDIRYKINEHINDIRSSIARSLPRISISAAASYSRLMVFWSAWEASWRQFESLVCWMCPHQFTTESQNQEKQHEERSSGRFQTNTPPRRTDRKEKV